MSQAAIVHAIPNRPEEALKDLRQAFQKGYSPEEARREPEFKSLQSRPEFAPLLAEFRPNKSGAVSLQVTNLEIAPRAITYFRLSTITSSEFAQRRFFPRTGTCELYV